MGICFSNNDDFISLSEFLDEYFNGNCLIDNIFGIQELNDYKSSLDILFLDKDDVINDTDFEKIKGNIGKNCSIIHCYDKDKIGHFKKMLDEISLNLGNKYVHFILPDSKRFIKLDDISYITQIGRMVVLTLMQGIKFKYAEDIDNLLSRINNNRFSKVACDYIVNFDYIERISKDNLIIKNGDIIPIHSDFVNEFENKYYKYKYNIVSSKTRLNTV